MKTSKDNLPPKDLRDKPLPEWSGKERAEHEPEGLVWNRDRQEWTD